MLASMAAFVSTCVPSALGAVVPPVDVVAFGDGRSVQAHRRKVTRSDVVRGGLGEPARRPLSSCSPPGRLMRIATVRESSQFEPSGLTYQVPDWVDGAHTRGFPPPGGLHQAFAGETLPIAKVPAGVAFKPGQENADAGKADFYTLRSGEYLIGMNCSKGKTFPMEVPPEFRRLPELVSKAPVMAVGPIEVGPESTVVFTSRP